MKAKIDERIKEEYEAKIEGKFKIYLGNKLYAKGKNKWTRYFPSSLVQQITNTNRLVGTDNVVCKAEIRLPPHIYSARAGNDTTTPTSPDMTDLVSKIDIAPDTKNIVLFKSSGYTEYKSRHKFMWNAGTIPAQTIGEFGVYLYLSDDGWTSPLDNPSLWTTSSYTDSDGKTVYVITPYRSAGTRLGARISSADGDFDPIDYTSEEALIFEWYVTIKF